MMLDGLRQFRVAQREKRALLQVKCKEAEPQSAEGEGQKQCPAMWAWREK